MNKVYFCNLFFSNLLGDTLIKIFPFVQNLHSRFFASLYLRNPGLIIFTSTADYERFEIIKIK